VPGHVTTTRRWHRAHTIIGAVVLTAVSAFALITVVIPLLLGAQTYTVLTGSMQPGMPPGTLVAVRPTPIDTVRVGDVITYQIRSGDPAVVTHRVVGSTLSTGGDRLLITRGDANDADDPPVQSAQLRGTVVLAVPLLGYPGVLFGGQERGAVIAAIGVVVVGYGLVLLASDLVRSRRQAAAAAAVLLCVAVSCVWTPVPSSAAAAGTDRLLLSDDGTTFSDSGDIAPFRALGALAPGDVRTAPLWIRNAGDDDARATVRLEIAPSSARAADIGFARALTPIVDGQDVASGSDWTSGTIRAGETLRVEVGVRMDAAATNDTRDARVSVAPTVGLAQVVGEAGPSSAPSPVGDLAVTGLDARPLVALGAVATAAVLMGLRLRRPRHGRHAQRR